MRPERERDKAGNGKLSHWSILLSFPDLCLFMPFLSPPQPPLPLPILTSLTLYHPISPTGSHPPVQVTTDPSVAQGESTCFPLPAKTLYPGFAFRPQASSRSWAPFLSTGFPSLSPPLALRTT